MQYYFMRSDILNMPKFQDVTRLPCYCIPITQAPPQLSNLTTLEVIWLLDN